MTSCVFIDSYNSDPRGPYTDAPEPMHAGPRAWRWLHLRSLDNGLTPELLAAFSRCIGCMDCRRHFQQIQHDIPFEEKNQFAWSVKAHNAVNESRRVPTMTVERARALWTGPRSRMVALGLAAPGVPQFSEVVTR
jgi:hypothetical protein